MGKKIFDGTSIRSLDDLWLQRFAEKPRPRENTLPVCAGLETRAKSVAATTRAALSPSQPRLQRRAATRKGAHRTRCSPSPFNPQSHAATAQPSTTSACAEWRRRPRDRQPNRRLSPSPSPAASASRLAPPFDPLRRHSLHPSSTAHFLSAAACLRVRVCARVCVSIVARCRIERRQRRRWRTTAGWLPRFGSGAVTADWPQPTLVPRTSGRSFVRLAPRFHVHAVRFSCLAGHFATFLASLSCV